MVSILTNFTRFAKIVLLFSYKRARCGHFGPFFFFRNVPIRSTNVRCGLPRLAYELTIALYICFGILSSLIFSTYPNRFSIFLNPLPRHFLSDHNVLVLLHSIFYQSVTVIPYILRSAVIACHFAFILLLPYPSLTPMNQRGVFFYEPPFALVLAKSSHS